MRLLVREAIENLRRSGERIGVDGKQPGAEMLGADVIRFARLATSIHLAESAVRLAAEPVSPDHLSPVREPAR